ncbi:unnamed protein product [Euphydryas editha]|uniref:Peptidase S1 domain-containing protein n=1 Tax=Euphydryas editha TaxID=104508 RepID=A0AAU9UX59_EUPED|nr:unnamed protein product [Euphydryas editha]
MRFLSLLFALCLTAAASGKPPQQRIIGGSSTSISNYPYAVAVLNNNRLTCGGVIINNRSVLTAAHCFYGSSASAWRLRVGSSSANSGGTVYNVNRLITHPNYQVFFENNVGIFRVSSSIRFGNNVQAGRFAGASYTVSDNQAVWTYGWGATSVNGPVSNQLRHVQIRTVNQELCRANYNIISMPVTSNEICAGNIQQGGQGPCSDGDNGGALLHNGNVIGISSWDSFRCGARGYPAIFTRVPRYINWILANA